MITGNGYALFNADIANSAVRAGAPAQAAGNHWGSSDPPVSGNASVHVDPVLDHEPPGVPEGAPGPVADDDPAGAIVDPRDGARVALRKRTDPVVVASDDFAIRSVALTAGGRPELEPACEASLALRPDLDGCPSRV